MAYQPTLTLLGLRMRATVDRQLAASALPTTWPSIDAHQLEQRVLLEQQRATAADAFTLPAAATRSDGYTGNGAPSTSGTWPAAPVSAPPHASTATASQTDGARRRPPPPPPGSSCDPTEVPAGSHAASPASARDEQARQSASRAERHAERALEVAERHTERALQLSAEMSVLSETVKEVAAASNTSAMQSVELSRAANSPARGAAQRMDGPDSFSRAAVPFDGNWHGPGVGELDTPVAVPDQASIVAAELALEAERRSTEALLLAIAEMDDDASEGGFTLDSQESASEFHTQAVARSQTLLEVHAAEMGQWRRVTLVLAWTCWVERTTSRSNAHHRAEQMGQRVIARLAHTELARALAAWIRWSAIKRRHAQLLKRAAARMSRSGLACALEGWRQYWMHAAQVRSTAQRVVLHFRGGLVARAFTSWSEQARWRVRSRLLVSHQLLRWVRSTEYHFFEAWRFSVAEYRRLRSAGKRVVYRLVEALMAQVFLQWAEHSRAANSRNRVLQVFVARWTMSTQYSAWVSWCEFMEFHRGLKRCLQRIMLRSIASAFGGWVSSLKAQRRKQHVLSYCIGHIRHTRLAPVFHAWEIGTLESRRQRQHMRSAIGRLQQRALAQAWDAWIDHRVMMNVLRRAVKRLQNLRIGQCFQHWQVVIALQKETAQRQDGIVTNAVQKWSNKQKAQAFAGWSTNALSRKRMRSRMQRTMLRLMHLREAAVFDAWYAAAADQRAILAAALRRLLHRQLDEAFGCWQWFVAERLKKHAEQAAREARMRRMLLRCQFFLTAQAFAGWLSQTQARQRKKRLGYRAIARMTRRQLAAAMDSWQRVTRGTRANRLAADQSSLDASLDELQAARQKLDMMFKQLAMYQEHQVGRMAQRQKMRSMHACFVLWHLGASAVANHHKRMASRVAALSARAKRKRASIAFVQWRNHARMVVNLVARGREKRLHMKLRLNRGKLQSAFATWYRARYGMNQLRRVTLVLAWTCWVERTTSRSNAHHRAEQMGQRVIARLAHTELARALAAWIRWSAIKRRHAQLLKRAAARMSRSGLACALEGWRQYWMHAAQVRSTAQRVVLHFRGGLVARAFTSWSEQARWRVRSRLLVSHQLLRWVRSTEYHFFEAWRLAAADAHRQRVLADEREQRWLLHLNYRDQQRHQRRLYGSFASWRVSVMRLRNGPEDNIDAAALQWNALSKSAVEIAAEERAKEEETAAEKQRVAKETARRLAQEQAARAAAEERAKQESQRLEQLTSVLQRAEQRARAMDLTIAEKSQRLSAAEAQLSWLMLGNPAATEDSDSSVGSPVLLARRSSLSPPHRLADGSGISLDFRRAISRSYGRGDGDGYDWPSFDDSVETSGQGLEDAWSAVADMAVGSPSNASTAGRSSPQGKRPSRMQGLAAQRRPA